MGRIEVRGEKIAEVGSTEGELARSLSYSKESFQIPGMAKN